MLLDTEYFAQHIQCSRSDKQDLSDYLQTLMEMALHARKFGLLDLEHLMTEEPGRFTDPFLRKAIAIILDNSDPQLVRRVLYNYILVSNYSGRHFLKAVVITETVIAMMAELDLDYIFSFLVPSYFGLDMDDFIQSLYRTFKANKYGPLENVAK